MPPRHQVSRAAITLIKRFEGYRRKAAQLPDGRWTIGYSHTLTARQGAEVSEADAEALLLYDMIGVAHTVSELVYADLTQNQFDALCAFAFSIGLAAFRGSEVLKRINEGAFTQAAFALELWRRADFQGERIVVDALVRRRAAEKLLFLTPPNDAWRVAPSAVLKPELDDTAPDTAPRGTPAQVVTSLDGAAIAVSREDFAAPKSDDPEPDSPVRAAAAVVTARLQTLFADAAPAALAEPLPDPAPAEEPRAEEPAPVETSPEPATAEAPAVAEPAPEPDPPPSLFRETRPDAADAPRVLIDDTAPFEFVPPPVQSLDSTPDDGLLVVVSLSALGLAFFAGGIFWAFNAPPGPQQGIFTPLLVGWLAGVAGVGFIAAAVFLLLQRVTHAAERRERRRP
ncbi:lysozyme [Phenylobacterium sp. LjRoot219]|uniref:lysozyme n=1 Tax=Phenylobacterium sp. LjRoot219 TaxID=3342283 RepID=UPI003ED06F3C